MCKEYIQYSVGSEIDRKIEAEGGILEIQDNICHCIIEMRNISENEAEAVSKGDITVALSCVDSIVFIAVKIAETFVFDMPFNMGYYKGFQLKDPDKEGYLMPIVFVDVNTNIIRAIRLVGFKNDFSKKLYELSKEQWDTPIMDFDKRVNRIYNNYTTQDLMNKCLACNVFKGCTEENTEVKNDNL